MRAKLLFLCVISLARTQDQGLNNSSPYAPVYTECPSNLSVRPASDVCKLTMHIADEALTRYRGFRMRRNPGEMREASRLSQHYSHIWSSQPLKTSMCRTSLENSTAAMFPSSVCQSLVEVRNLDLEVSVSGRLLMPESRPQGRLAPVDLRRFSLTSLA